jgi:general stress protein 26
MESRDHDRDTLRALLSGMEYAMLATRAADGALVSRPLQLLQVDAACMLWFFTSATSGKLEEIRTDARVNVAFADPSRKIFLSISGNASVIDDRAKAEALWSAAQKIFYPMGPDDPSLTLLCIVPHTAHYWDGNESTWGLLKKFGKAVLLREASDLGTSAQLDIEK